MDETEARALAAEEAVIAIAAHIKPLDVQAAILHLRDEAADLAGEERAIKLAAAELLDAGLRRFDEFTTGRLFR